MSSSVLAAVLVLAAWSDWKRRKIPNWLLFPAMLTGFGHQVWVGEYMSSLEGIACGFAVSFIPVLLRTMGMGDQKLLMVIGAWTSAGVVVQLFLLAGLLSVGGLLVKRGRVRRLCRNISILAAGWSGQRQFWLPAHHESAMTIPFAVVLCGAFLLQEIGGVFK